MNVVHLKHGCLASYILDWSRFIAAFIVLEYHVTGNSIIPGYQAVMIFFVLSGFFISSSVLNTMINRKWSWKYYLVSRFTRLWTVLLPALALSALWVAIQIHFRGMPFIKTGIFEGDMNVSTLIQNIFFLQGVTTPYLFGFNGPLWSLSFEFWYYILFPIMVLFFKQSTTLKKVSYGTLFIAISIFLSFLFGIHILAYYVIWLLGALIVISNPIKLIKKHPVFSLTFTSVLTVISTYLLYFLFDVNHPRADMTHYFPDISVAVCFALFIYVVVNTLSEYKNISIIGKIGSYLAGMAYTLYLTHYPVINFLSKMNIYSNVSGIKKILLFLFISAAILIYSDLISHLTERHTLKIKKILLSFISTRKVVENKAL